MRKKEIGIEIPGVKRNSVNGNIVSLSQKNFGPNRETLSNKRHFVLLFFFRKVQIENMDCRFEYDYIDPNCDRSMKRSDLMYFEP